MFLGSKGVNFLWLLEGILKEKKRNQRKTNLKNGLKKPWVVLSHLRLKLLAKVKKSLVHEKNKAEKKIRFL